jgi:hypothetical protein
MIGHSGRCGYLARTFLADLKPVTLGLRRGGRENVTGNMHIVKQLTSNETHLRWCGFLARPWIIVHGQISPKEHKLVEGHTEPPCCRGMKQSNISRLTSLGE